MGCDIHWTIEVKNDAGRWVGVLNDYGLTCRATVRWYPFFGELAGVRRETDTAYQPRGLPDDVSDLTRLDMRYSAWDHTGSWLTVEEFVAAYNRAVIKYAHEDPDSRPLTVAELFGYSDWPFNGEVVRVVFAFDN